MQKLFWIYLIILLTSVAMACTGGGDDDSSGSDEADENDDDDDDDDCISCNGTSVCLEALGPGWVCLNGCCEEYSDDDTDDDANDDIDDDVNDDADDDIDDDVNDDADDDVNDDVDDDVDDDADDDVDDDVDDDCDDPVADFSATPRAGTAPLSVAFTDLSQAPVRDCEITGWEWDFGDGHTSAAAEPSHQYEQGGSYSVSLTVENNGGSDIEQKVDYIAVTCPEPVAEFNADVTSGPVPLTVQFNDQSVIHCSNITYEWDFGDGNTSSLSNPEHTFETNGVFTVTLTVTTDGGVDTRNRSDYISANCSVPQANFTAWPREGRMPLEVDFHDSSTSNCPILSHDWVFGDGQTSRDEDPTNIYADVGVYTVSLTVTSDGGQNTESKDDYITVRPNPIVGQFANADDARDVVVVGDYAYIANGENGFYIANVTNPASPTYMDSAGSRSYVGIDVEDSHAFIADPNIGDGFHIYNVANPGDIQYVDSYTDDGQSCWDVDVMGDYAYMATGGRGLTIVNISDPDNPDYISELDPGGYSNGVVATEQDGTPYAVMAVGSGGLRIIDVSDPLHPNQVWEYDTSDAERVFVNGQYVFLADGMSGMKIFDVFIFAPEYLGAYHDSDSFTKDVGVQGSYAYMSDYGSGLTVVNVGDYSNPIFEDRLDTNGYTHGLFIGDDNIYLADDENGLFIIEKYPTSW